MDYAGARIVVSGVVQGVGYRFFAEREGDSLGLAGYVRNMPDGSVELEVEGERENIEAFVKILKEGPRAARVTNVHVEWREKTGAFRGFRIEL